MKLTNLLTFSTFATLIAASPTSWLDWTRSTHPKQPVGLEGYAWDNPFGPTTGGSNGKVFTVKSDKALLAALEDYSKSKTIYLDGTFRPAARLAVGSNISLIGKGKGANIMGEGLNVYNATNVIIRNLGIRFVVGGDGMTIQNSTRVWVDHCEFESEFSEALGPDYYVSIRLSSMFWLSADCCGRMDSSIL